MKGVFAITDINDNGDRIEAKATGKWDAEGEYWACCRSITISVPVHIGKKYTIGRRLRVTVEPGQ